MRVKLYLSLSKKGLPAVLTVRDFGGEVLFYKVIKTAENVVYFDTCGRRNIIVAVRPYNADYYESSQFIKLPCSRCFVLCLSFEFVKRTEGSGFTQAFYLYDEFYRFPIADAVLRFFGL